MFPSVSCVHCGTKLKARFRVASGKKIRCGACGHELPPQAMEDLLRMQGLMRMGDDDGGGGGDWGGGGGDDHDDGGKGEAEDEDEEEDDDDDGKGAKKKKKSKSNVTVHSGGFFQSLLRGFISRVIGAVIGLVLLFSCCCCVVGYSSIYNYFFPTPPFVGTWEGSENITMKEKDDKGKEIDKEKKVAVVLVINKIDEMKGTGSITTSIDEVPGKVFTFTWRDHNKEKKTIVMELDDKQAKFWKGINSPATFSYNVVGSNLTLASGDKSMVFAKPAAEIGPRANKGGGGNVNKDGDAKKTSPEAKKDGADTKKSDAANKKT